MPMSFKLALFGQALLIWATFANGKSLAESVAKETAGKEAHFYVGAYSRNGSKGICHFGLDLSTGRIHSRGLAAAYQGADEAPFRNASFLVMHPHQPQLYAVSEVDDYKGTNGGALIGFAVDGPSGKLARITTVASGGAGPCHLTVDRSGKWALVANYGSGSVGTFSLQARGTGGIGSMGSLIQHEGRSVHPARQTGPHAHSVDLDPSNRFALVCDLGLDKVFVYRFDDQSGQLTPNDPPFVATAQGAGPRHLAFHPDGKFVYVVNELNNTVAAYRYKTDQGRLEGFQTLGTLPEDYHGDNSTAEIQVHPTGKYLYCSNRGHDSIAMFAIDSATGGLAPLGQHPCGGRTPRHFAIDPSGRYLLSAHQDSDSIVVHSIDPATGRLAETTHQVSVPSPVCVLFVQP